jgi:hypothetical protein
MVSYKLVAFKIYLILLMPMPESTEQALRNRMPTSSSEMSPRRDSVRNGLLSQKQLRMFAHPMDAVQTDMR